MWKQEVHRRNAEGRAATKKRKVEETARKHPWRWGAKWWHHGKGTVWFGTRMW